MRHGGDHLAAAAALGAPTLPGVLLRVTKDPGEGALRG